MGSMEARIALLFILVGISLATDEENKASMSVQRYEHQDTRQFCSH